MKVGGYVGLFSFVFQDATSDKRLADEIINFSVDSYILEKFYDVPYVSLKELFLPSAAESMVDTKSKSKSASGSGSSNKAKRLEFPLNITKEEHDVINIKEDILLLGRSGTGTA